MNTSYAVVQGHFLEVWPKDLYVPPHALQIFLESFEGPLDLLLYLIQNQHLDILNIPIAEITQQYLHYIELMKESNLDLASEYLLMAAILMEIKSRMLLPLPKKSDHEPHEDPRTRLVQQLQEYARYKQAAQDLDSLPQIGRDIFSVMVAAQVPKEVVLPHIPWSAVLQAMRDIIERTTLYASHKIMREPLSVRERMTTILEKLTTARQMNFVDFFTPEEGRAGAVVTLLALLELAKQVVIHIMQTQPFDVLQVISLQHD